MTIADSTKRLRRTPRLATVAAMAALLMTSGCAANEPSANTLPRTGLKCVDDSNHCISQREMVFDSYMADKSRSWMAEPATPEAYASGVRLFAMSKRRREMSCDELRRGKREADAGPAVLRGSGGSRLTTAQISRGVMLATEVSRELGRELSRRCGNA
jgi:hypothetical protein